MSKPRYKSRLADLGLFYAALIWGSTFFIVKDALSGIDPIILVGYRFTIAGLLMYGYLLWSGRPLFKDFKQGFILAIILWFLYVPQTIGLGYTKASNSGFITGLFVAFVPVFMRLIFKRKPTRWEVVAAILSLFGLWILTGGLTDINIGDILTLGAATTYALHVLYTDKYMKEGIDPYIISTQQFLLIGLISLVVGFVFDLPFEVGSTRVIWIILFLALFPTLSAFLIQAISQKFASPMKVCLIFAFEPVFAAIFSWTLGGEQVILTSALGGLLIAAALAISGIPEKPKEALPEHKNNS